VRYGFKRDTPWWLLVLVIVVGGILLAVLGPWILDTIQSLSVAKTTAAGWPHDRPRLM